MAQFVQWSIPSPKTCSSNPVIGTFFTTINFIEKTKNKEKRGRECPNFLKQNKVQLGWHALGNNECVATVKDESPDHRHRMGGHLHRDKKNEKSFPMVETITPKIGTGPLNFFTPLFKWITLKG